MIEYKQGVQARFFALLTDSVTGNAKSGVTYDQAALWVKKADGSVAQATVDNTTFSEASGGNFAGAGLYAVIVAGSIFDQPGPIALCMTATGCDPFITVAKVIGNEIVDVYGRVGAPVGASISADVAAVKSDTAANVTSLAAVKAKTDNLPANTATVLAGLATPAAVAAAIDADADVNTAASMSTTAASEAASARDSADAAATAAEEAVTAVQNIKPATGYVHLG